ncbi:MAG TPA: hypothetical protein VN285_10420, partial [Candidatus Deferrimicrobium sp.]|nr:hypothetical protein [Candidatus Deferrimicrobium sp.]
MNESSATGFRLAVNRTALSVYFTAGILALSIAAVYLILRERYLLLLFLPAIPVVVYLATNTRWAVYQYIFCLFFLAPFGSETSFSLVDLSGLLVLVAAAIDLFADHRLPRRFPPLFFNFILVLTAVCVAAVFAYEPILALNPISRLTMLAVTFLALYRLIDISDLGRFLRIFLWLSVLHAIAVALPFLLSAGVIRSYGLSGVAYDDLAMLTLPIGLSLFLWSRRGRSLKYLVGSFAVFCGLVATKSRASMLFALFAA